MPFQKPWHSPTAPEMREPISAAIGLTSLIAGLLGTTAAIGGAASLIGGAIVGVAPTISLSFGD